MTATDKVKIGDYLREGCLGVVLIPEIFLRCANLARGEIRWRGVGLHRDK